MEHLPNVEQEVEQIDSTPPPKPEIFVRPEELTETTASAPASPTKKKRSYNRDPEEMKQHMANMRAKALESRRRKKAAKEASAKEQTAAVPTQPTSINTGYVKVNSRSDFDSFMTHYAKVEEYKQKIANEKAEREEYIEAQIEARLAKRKAAAPPAPPVESNPFEVYFR